jgi:hypothetical protein
MNARIPLEVTQIICLALLLGNWRPRGFCEVGSAPSDVRMTEDLRTIPMGVPGGGVLECRLPRRQHCIQSSIESIHHAGHDFAGLTCGDLTREVG